MKLGDVGNEEAMAFGKPLAGVRVLALEQMQSLPWATQLLARLGAEVVKVEPPGTGEPGRLAQPAVLDPQGRSLGATFLRTNLNKRSICINFKHEDGRALLKRMLARYDVFCENFKPGTLAALGLDYPTLSADNPHLIYFSLSGFGQTRESPYQNWPAYAAVAEAMSGAYEQARLPHQAPIPNPIAGLGDSAAGMFGVIGVLAALRHRDRIGRGQHVDIAMLDTMLTLADYGMNVWSLGLRRNPDDEFIQSGIHHTFRARDGWFMLQVVREHQFAALARLIGCESWLTDERLSTRLGWGQHIESLIRPGIEAWAATRTRMEICQAMAAKGVPAGPCLTHQELVADLHVRSHDALVEIPRPNGDGPPVLVAGNPIKMSAVSEGPETRMPWVGEHTAEVLHADLGLDDDKLASLYRNGVIG
jgi:formyl-CoA transferase